MYPKNKNKQTLYFKIILTVKSVIDYLKLYEK